MVTTQNDNKTDLPTCPECGGVWLSGFTFDHEVNGCSIATAQDVTRDADLDRVNKSQTCCLQRPASAAELALMYGAFKASVLLNPYIGTVTIIHDVNSPSPTVLVGGYDPNTDERWTR